MPRVREALSDEGIEVGKWRVRRLMRTAGLEGRAKKRRRTTTVADPQAEAAKDLIQRHFGPGKSSTVAMSATSPTSRPGKAGPTWPRSSTWPLDASWAGPWPTTCAPSSSKRPCNGLRPAPTPRGVIFHSDRGCQYTSGDYAQLAQTNGVVLSVGRKGECWDNAVAESFFATIKRESSTRGPGRRERDFAALSSSTSKAGTTRVRLHSSLGYMSPAKYEALIHHNADRQAA